MDSDGSSVGDTATLQRDAERRVLAQVEEALELAAYVVETGVTDGHGQPLAFDAINTINTAAIALGLIGYYRGNGPPEPGPPSGWLTATEWNAFAEAYYRLAIATSPVTVETLRATKATSRAELTGSTETLSLISRLGDFIFGYSPAQRFTRVLWFIAMLFAGFVITAEWQINLLGLREDAAAVQVRKSLWESLVPWAYGGLGACAYLLRSAHYFIYRRTFNLRRTPEYINRIGLGMISGGAIILFWDYLTADDDSVIQFGSAAVGFIAGYSSDFLFNTIERIVTAIFPRVAVETVPRDAKRASDGRPGGTTGGAKKTVHDVSSDGSVPPGNGDDENGEKSKLPIKAATIHGATNQSMKPGVL